MKITIFKPKKEQKVKLAGGTRNGTEQKHKTG